MLLKINLTIEADLHEALNGWADDGVPGIIESLKARLDAVPNDAGGETHFEVYDFNEWIEE